MSFTTSNGDSDNDSELTTLHSGETTTLPGDEAPTIQALFNAADDAAYTLAVAKIPTDHRVRYHGVHYVLYEPYRSTRSKRGAWYWNNDQAVEMIRTSKSKFYLLYAALLLIN